MIDPIAVSALVISIAAAFRAHFHSNARKTDALVDARRKLGEKYAALGWAYASVQKDSDDQEKARKHAFEGFIIADTNADGKRDFTDRQVAVYVDAAKRA